MRTDEEFRDVRSWERSVQASLSPMHVIPSDRVRVRYRVSSAGPIRIGDIDSSPGVVRRATRIEPDPAVAFLGVQRAGEAVMRQNGRAMTLDPGWAAFHRHGTSIEYEYPRAFRRTVIRIPVGAIGLMPGDLDTLEGRPLSLESTIGRVLDQALQAMTDAADAARLAGPMASLIGAFVDDALEIEAPSGGAVALADVLVAIRELAFDSGTTLQDVADTVHVSSRQIQRVLRANGTTYQRALVLARLDAAAAVLRRDRAVSPAEVAASVGFSSASHFSRTFRARFGAPPATWRDSQR